MITNIILFMIYQQHLVDYQQQLSFLPESYLRTVGTSMCYSQPLLFLVPASVVFGLRVDRPSLLDEHQGSEAEEAPFLDSTPGTEGQTQIVSEVTHLKPTGFFLNPFLDSDPLNDPRSATHFAYSRVSNDLLIKNSLVQAAPKPHLEKMTRNWIATRREPLSLAIL